MSCTIRINDVVNIQPDDVAFWLSQFAEHAAFIAGLLNAEAAPRLAEEAAHLAGKFQEEAARGNGQYDANVLLKYFAFLELLKHKLHKIPQVVTDMKDKHFCHLIKHYLMELTYFVRLAHGKVQVWEDIEFWVMEAIDHILLFASLIGDEHPERKHLHKLAKAIKCAWKMSRRHPLLLKVVAKELMMHGEMIQGIRGVIRGAAMRGGFDMVLHEMRETDRGLMRIKFFLENLAEFEHKHKHEQPETVVVTEEKVVTIERK